MWDSRPRLSGPAKPGNLLPVARQRSSFARPDSRGGCPHI